MSHGGGRDGHFINVSLETEIVLCVLISVLASCVLVFVKLKSVVTDSEVLTKSNKIKELMEVKIDTIRNQQSEQTLS